MRLRFILAVPWVSALLGFVTPASALSVEEFQVVAEIVQQLGSELYPERQQAYERLKTMGQYAVEAVERGLTSQDPDIRVRCEQLLLELQYLRIEAYLNGTPWSEDDRLASLERFKQNVISDDEQAREIFRELYQATPQFVNRLEYDRERAIESLNRFVASYRRGWRGYAFQPDQKQLPISSLTLLYQIMAAESNDREALVLAGYEARAEGAGEKFRDTFIAHVRKPWDVLISDEKRASIQDIYRYYKDVLLQLPGDAEFKKAVRDQILTPYIASRIAFLQGDALAKNKRTATDILYFFGKLGCAEIYLLAKRVLASPDFTSREKYGSIIAIGQYGTKDDIPALETFLDDQATYRRGREGRYGLTIGDVALTAVIHLSGEKYVDYNLVGATNGFSDSTFLNIAFPSKEDRDAAYAKWKARQAENPRD